MRHLPARWALTGVFILSLLPFLAVEAMHSRLYHVMNITKYLVFHNMAEFFSVMVSMSIFGVGWFTFGRSKDRHVLFLSTAFLAIGLMDFMHTMAYAGMPSFITPNSANKSTQFWIAVRLYAATVFLASAYIYPDTPGRWLSKRILMTAALAVSAVVFTGVIFFPERMPATFIDGAGLTGFKKYSEYLIIFLLVLASAAYWQRMSRTGDRLLVYYPAAFILCIFSELVFAVYKSVFDTYNVLGHVYKVAAFSLIYKGIFTSSVNIPYLKLTAANENLRMEIAGRKEADDRISRAKEEWERTFDAIVDPLMVVDTDFRITKANRAMGDKLGISPSSAEGLTCYRAVHGCNQPPPFCPHAGLLADGRHHSVEIHEERLGGEFLVSVSPLVTADGKLFGSVHYARDITEKKRAEKAVEAERRRFNEVLELLPAYLVLLTKDYHVPFANRFFRERFGESRGRRCFEYLFGRSEPCEICETYTVLKTNAPHRWQWTGPDGRNYDIYDFPFTDADGSSLIMEMGIDITDRKRAEDEIRRLNVDLEERVAERTAQLEAVNGELEAFAYSVSHDLRAPLRGIDGFSQALLEDYRDKLDERGQDYLRRVRTASKRMAQLIDDLLKLSRITRTEMKLEAVDLSALARSVAENLQHREPGRKVAFNVADGLVARGDALLLQVALENLLENAWKFTGKNELPEIEFGVKLAEGNPVYFIRDNGAGFDMTYAGKLFIPFQRLHSYDEFPGTGIGLSIVQRIILRHGGEIRAEGNVSKGAAFYFTLGTGG